MRCEKSIFNKQFASECTPGYYNNEGRADKDSLFANVYGGGPADYANVLAEAAGVRLEHDYEVTSK